MSYKNNNNGDQTEGRTLKEMSKSDDKKIAPLLQKVAFLKNLTLSISEESTKQNDLLDRMERGFVERSSSLGQNLKQLIKLSGFNGQRHMHHLSMFIFFAICFLYFISKLR
ncbi:protein transport protein bet1 [Bonamia ostreae]|uniref:Protein transport protein bet1 n=1 Tax=Bonamia ostreae TaxID=126728 RepID=A0ABV2AJ00_9EUKA